MAFEIPWLSLIGGMLLGLSALVLMLCNGKIAGISGIVAGLLSFKKSEVHWRLAFIIGIFLSSYIVYPFEISLPEIDDYNLFIVVLAGLLVGFGTRLGNGCTSGHGIVGVGRFSKRSIYATCIFIISAIVVVFIRRLLGIL